MDNDRLLTCLEADYRRLRDVAARDLTAEVPSCPGWTVDELVRHVATVYLHKTECMRLGAMPDPWPPDLSAEQPVALLDRSYAALAGEFSARRPGDHAATWYPPDQSVGFWIRRMAQETVIHRIDAELALGEPVAPIPADLALDGVDEVLCLFLSYATRTWADEIAELKSATGRTVRVGAGDQEWLVRTEPSGVVIAADGAPVATVRGAPDAVLRWLWARGADDAVTVDGDADAVTELRGLLAATTT